MLLFHATCYQLLLLLVALHYHILSFQIFHYQILTFTCSTLKTAIISSYIPLPSFIILHNLLPNLVMWHNLLPRFTIPRRISYNHISIINSQSPREQSDSNTKETTSHTRLTRIHEPYTKTLLYQRLARGNNTNISVRGGNSRHDS